MTWEPSLTDKITTCCWTKCPEVGRLTASLCKPGERFLRGAWWERWHWVGANRVWHTQAVAHSPALLQVTVLSPQGSQIHPISHCSSWWTTCLRHTCRARLWWHKFQLKLHLSKPWKCNSALGTGKAGAQGKLTGEVKSKWGRVRINLAQCGMRPSPDLTHSTALHSEPSAGWGTCHFTLISTHKFYCWAVISSDASDGFPLPTFRAMAADLRWFPSVGWFQDINMYHYIS